ncbi:MAG: hypothetical protein DKM50_14190 [Candidatus Margulisiibacteriota bacterium]|nr:MAG: hypothetical protein A2X43_09325 [Candidatus Margulisbacteria bacterium GWD2_39_127]OGI05567.1 MAG: hypothetical protein A2X42_06840 [Candidatus Margulisbacteria bacterium GWF2_38_17]OGI09495.1 MAG: hypothetical protein A2X41_09725 [Candidatus Margulisbacteria bacterium GWE2_39_32]PZM77020.1 MAG: hypothetical protein DKM50_14190 [Candidatus Margulisiibacteriota bacterium]HAR62098.1 hypothetical protein [Candidatus Margulisiibacteriota bacterium]
MNSKKIFYQHLYKELIEEIEVFDGNRSVQDAQSLIDKIYSLSKGNKRDVLLKKVQTNRNFLEYFNVLLAHEIVNLGIDSDNDSNNYKTGRF